MGLRATPALVNEAHGCCRQRCERGRLSGCRAPERATTRRGGLRRGAAAAVAAAGGGSSVRAAGLDAGFALGDALGTAGVSTVVIPSASTRAKQVRQRVAAAPAAANGDSSVTAWRPHSVLRRPCLRWPRRAGARCTRWSSKACTAMVATRFMMPGGARWPQLSPCLACCSSRHTSGNMSCKCASLGKS
jgi:hypothetical protein